MIENWIFQLWIVLRQMKSSGRFLGMTTSFSILGMIIGVASLVLSMSVVSGFDTALKSSVIDFSGHLIIMKYNGLIDETEEILPKLRKITSQILSFTPFVQVESIVAVQGRTSGITVLGLEPESARSVMDLENRIVEGKLSLLTNSKEVSAVIGKGLASKFNIGVGQDLEIVTPRPVKNSHQFSPKSMKVRVSGIVDLGKYEFDSRFVVVSAASAMELRGGPKGYSGLRLKFTDESVAEEIKAKIESSLGYPYWSKSWFDVSRNLFEAIKIEKVVILIVVLLLVIMASFNICSTLYVNVLRRYGEIAIMQTMGASPQFMRRIFILHGLVIGALGCLGGIAVGMFLSWYLPQTKLFEIPAEVYKLDRLRSEVRTEDLVMILVTSMLICLVSTFAPARTGSKLRPVEGLRRE